MHKTEGEGQREPYLRPLGFVTFELIKNAIFISPPLSSPTWSIAILVNMHLVVKLEGLQCLLFNQDSKKQRSRQTVGISSAFDAHLS